MPLPIAVGLYGIITAFFSSMWSRLWVFLMFSLPFIAEKLIKLLGVSIITYIGIDLVFGQLEDWIFAKFDNLPTDVYAMLVLADLDWAIKSILSAMVAIFALKPAQQMTYKKSTFEA